MDTLITIAVATAIVMGIALFIVPLAVTHLTTISNAETVRGLIDRFFMIFLSIPEMLRNGSFFVFRSLWEYCREAARSTGVNGEHRIQRIVGAILITLFTLISILVSILVLAITLEAPFGSENQELVSMLPVSPETLIAVELVFAGILFGIFLLDILKVTHVTKFYSPDHLPAVLTYIFAGIFTIGILGSAYILMMGGNIRVESFFNSKAQALPAYQVDVPSNDGQIINRPNDQINPAEMQRQGLIPEEADVQDIPVEYSPEYRKALSRLLIGTPLISFFAGLFGAVGLLPFCGLLISGLSFIPALVILGPFWAIGRVGMALVNHIYTLVRYYLDIFIQRAETARNREGASNNNPANNPPPPPPSAAESNSPDTSGRTESPQDMANNSPAGDQPAAASNSGGTQQGQEENPIYSQNDPNWNPLI